jgi:hypothetical protein
MIPVLFALTACPLVCGADGPLVLEGRKQLFFDRRFIEKSDRITLHMNPPQKMGLVRDDSGRPLQGHISQAVEDQGKIQLYLGADGLERHTSDDGMTFHRTGSIPGGILPSLLIDRKEADPAKRYKLFRLETKAKFDPATDGVVAYTSPDGLNFTKAGRVFPFYTDNPANVYWDARIGKYVIFLRALAYDSENQRRIARIETDDPLKPWPYTKTSNDRMFPTPDNLTVVLQADEKIEPHSDLYYNSATLYPEAQDAYLMFTAPFRHFSPNRQPFVRPRPGGGWEDFGMLEVQLAVSRDGIHWSRPSREPYIATGLADEWDRWYAVAGPGLVRKGNYLYQYYYSSGRLHDSANLRAEYEKTAAQLGGVGLVRQRLDGFVSADADQDGGWLETPAFTFTGARLRLNIDAGATGTAFVELRDADHQPIPGFTLADCEEICGNMIDQRVHWKGNPDVSPLAGRPVRLYLKLHRAKLYAFQFTKE